MRKQIVLLFASVAILLINQRLSAQSWTLPENVTNNTSIFDQQPSLDIGPAPFFPAKPRTSGTTELILKRFLML